MTMFLHVLIATVFVLTTPALALACAVCGTSGIENNSWAYFAMTMVLSGLPLGMIGGVVFWVYRRAVKAEGGERNEVAVPAASDLAGR